ncbi:hypothetical protein VNO77_17879 [Canavalia gladiata]|uniref:Uncharacterized protein n=1 Tax=Canavalia gladiata TaxID=3824 RepID=A0AAN9LPR9_CANGL
MVVDNEPRSIINENASLWKIFAKWPSILVKILMEGTVVKSVMLWENPIILIEDQQISDMNSMLKLLELAGSNGG